MTATRERTDAQQDRIRQLRKRHRELEVRGFDTFDRIEVVLPDDGEGLPERRRIRYIAPSGLVERS